MSMFVPLTEYDGLRDSGRLEEEIQSVGEK